MAKGIKLKKYNLKQIGAKKICVAENIYLLKFKDNIEMAKTFLRFQEHYESPKFRNKIFSLKEFKIWYAKKYGKGKFTYYKDWGGFNIPSYILVPFFEKKFNPLSKREKCLLSAFKNMRHPFYIIGAATYAYAMRHEIVHGTFYTNVKYAKKVLKLLSGADISDIKYELLKIGYCKDTLLDEINAYSVDAYNGLTGWFLDKYVEKNKNIVKKLGRLYEKIERERK
jgi:hypothetical protein